jgi:hypothetical protein
MNAYDRFLSSLLSEFTRKAQSQLRSLWADLMELEEAIDGRSFSAAREQVLHRVRVFRQAASATNAHPVQSLSQMIEHRLRVLTQTGATACPELFTHLHETMWTLADAVYELNVENLAFQDGGPPTDQALVASGAD